MGADLITAVAATTRQEEDLNWDAGKEVVRSLTLESLEQTGLLEFLYGGDADLEEVREELEGRIDDLRNSITQFWRDLNVFTFGEWTIYIAGGTSWGDSPGDTFEAINQLGQAPGVLEAIGFDWPEGATA